MLRGYLKKGQLELADRVMEAVSDSGLRRNRETYEILLDYHVSAGRLKDTWAVIAKMRQDGFEPNSFVYSKIIGLYRDNGMWKKAIAVIGEIRENGVSLDKQVYNSIIDTFDKSGELRDALEVFEEMHKEGIRPWNLLDVHQIGELVSCCKLHCWSLSRDNNSISMKCPAYSSSLDFNPAKCCLFAKKWQLPIERRFVDLRMFVDFRAELGRLNNKTKGCIMLICAIKPSTTDDLFSLYFT